jgi:hypothetical protein
VSLSACRSRSGSKRRRVREGSKGMVALDLALLVGAGRWMRLPGPGGLEWHMPSHDELSGFTNCTSSRSFLTVHE